MSAILAVDVGGTKTQFGLLRGESLDWVREYASGAVQSFAELVDKYLEELAAAKIAASSIKACGIGAAGPVRNHTVQLTNLSWSVESETVAKQLGAPTVLMNDLVAQAYGMIEISAAQVAALDRNPQLGHQRAFLAVGTGLGQAIVGFSGERPVVLSTEGGHTDFAPQTELDWRYLQFLQRRYPQHVSWERVVSGSEGFANLYSFATEILGHAAVEGSVDGRGLIAAAESGNKTANFVVEQFVDYLAQEAGNFALKSLPLGGLFFGGSVCLGLQKWLTRPRFAEVFAAKGRFTGLLATVPKRLVLDPNNGLRGAGIGAQLAC